MIQKHSVLLDSSPSLDDTISEMKLIVGLGNLGTEYQYSRHNVGFMFADLLASKFSLKFEESSKLHSLVERHEELIIAKPTTMMNASGRAVAALRSFYKIQDEDLYVVHDDLDVKLGNFKLQKAKGPQLHNGISDIENKLGSAMFWRGRIGIENRDPARKIPGEAYVLQDFSKEERESLEPVFKNLLLALEL